MLVLMINNGYLDDSRKNTNYWYRSGGGAISSFIHNLQFIESEILHSNDIAAFHQDHLIQPLMILFELRKRSIQ